MPLLTPALHARTPFKLLMRLLFPTLGKPEGKKSITNEHSDYVFSIQKNENYITKQIVKFWINNGNTLT